MKRRLLDESGSRTSVRPLNGRRVAFRGRVRPDLVARAIFIDAPVTGPPKRIRGKSPASCLHTSRTVNKVWTNDGRPVAARESARGGCLALRRTNRCELTPCHG